MYKTIQTTTGQFSIQKLEKVLMHEHIVLGYAGWFYDPRCAEFDHAKAEEKTLDRLKRLRDYGVNLVVPVQSSWEEIQCLCRKCQSRVESKSCVRQGLI